jgi:hypothetical protein
VADLEIDCDIETHPEHPSAHHERRKEEATTIRELLNLSSQEADAAATGTCEAVDPRGVVPGGHVAGDDVHNDAAGKSTGGPPEGMPGTCLLLDTNAASIFTV